MSPALWVLWFDVSGSESSVRVGWCCWAALLDLCTRGALLGLFGSQGVIEAVSAVWVLGATVYGRFLFGVGMV